MVYSQYRVVQHAPENPGLFVWARSGRLPTRPRTLCLHQGCTEVVRGRPYCPRHTPVRPGDERPSSTARGYTRIWQKIRAAYLAAHPYCAMCGRPASQVHHRLSLREGGGNDWGNLQALCAGCHSRITRRGMGLKS